MLSSFAIAAFIRKNRAGYSMQSRLYSCYRYSNVHKALTKAKELLLKPELGERLVVGTAYCGRNLRTGEILELVPSEDGLEIGVVKYEVYKEELLRIEPADFSSWPEGTPEHIFGDV